MDWEICSGEANCERGILPPSLCYSLRKESTEGAGLGIPHENPVLLGLRYCCYGTFGWRDASQPKKERCNPTPEQRIRTRSPSQPVTNGGDFEWCLQIEKREISHRV